MKRDIDFLYEMGSFRFVERTWKHFFRGDVENNAEHTFRVAWIALVLARYEGASDHGKILKMALLHDLGESRAGDANYISRLYTERNERQAIADIFYDTSLSDELPALWAEYEERMSIEAKIVKDADMLDVDFEIAEQAARGQKLADTWSPQRREAVRPKLCTEAGKKLFDEIYGTDPHHWHLSAKNRFTAGDYKPSEKKL